MRPFLHPLAFLVLVTGGIAAVIVEDRSGWSSRAPWILTWTFLGYAALIATQRASNMSWRDFLRARPDDSIGREGRAPINIDPGPSATTAGTGDAPVPIQEALRSLNNPAALGNCALAGILPRTIRAFGPELSDPRLAGTSLFRARALRSALVAGIETLRTSGGEGLPEAESLRYTILHEEYVLGRPNTQIMVRHSISESTFHRYRREAARLLGQELARQEEMLGVESPPGLGGGDD